MTQGNSFIPPWWLRNGHLQTLYPALFRTVHTQLSIRRERLETPDGDFLDIEHCGDGEGPIIILLHGLTGSSRSSYIIGFQTVLNNKGYRSIALNFRGCSGEMNNRARCYHSGETEDIDFVYRTLRQRYSNVPLGAIGFSLGGNVLLKWLGEQGDRVDLFAAVAVSVPLVLSICASRLDKGLSKLYRASLLRELKYYINTKKMHLRKIGNKPELEKIEQVGDLTDVTSFWQYDDRVVARLHGYKNVHDYYRRASSRQFLGRIKIPTLLIQANDDPFMTESVLPTENELSAHVTLEVTKGGGHVGFIEGSTPFKPNYWLERRIPMFLAQHLPSQKEQRG